MMIPLSKAWLAPTAHNYVQNVLSSGKISGQGLYTTKCEEWFEENMPSGGKAFLVTSGTSALEMAAMLLIEPGDEVIFPSYTYVSTVNAFVVRGAVPVFVDIESCSMNVDPELIEPAVTPRTRAIVPVHYAGIPCDMDIILEIAKRHNLFVIEDAAQGICSTYKSQSLGTIGDLGCISFHETKNFTSGGQGGALLVNRAHLVSRAEVIYDNGTNRIQFLRGEVSQYSWHEVGSNFVMSEVLAALLWSHLEHANDIQAHRMSLWNAYHDALAPLARATGGKLFTVPGIPDASCEVIHNAHIFYLKITNPEKRGDFVMFMKCRRPRLWQQSQPRPASTAHNTQEQVGISVAPHYVPLHSTSIGQSRGRFVGEDVNTTLASRQLIRLPLYHELSAQEQQEVIEGVKEFFEVVLTEDEGRKLRSENVENEA